MEYMKAKSILQRSKSTAWFGTDHTMNLYRGCPHGCIYCDSRSECYGIEDFDRVRAKENALAILQTELARKVRPCMIGMGSMSDPYNPAEKTLELTRYALELIDAYSHGVKITTKSDLIVRDIDVLGFVKQQSPVICGLTITTTDDSLAAKIEPHAPSPTRRLSALEKLSQAGLFSGVLMMPVLPFLEDNPENVLAVIEATAQAGGKFVYPAFGMTLRDRQRAYYMSQLERLYPGEELPQRYRKAFGSQYSCTSKRARELWNLCKERCQALGLRYEMKDIVSASQQGYGDRQLSFFE